MICAEILAIKIRKSKDVKGIHFIDGEKKPSMLAADTSLILDGSEKSLQSSLNILRDFAKISVLHINYNKTQVVWIGCKKHCDDIICTMKLWGGARRLLVYLHRI